MNASEISRLQVADRPELTAVPGAAEYLRCDECEAPVEEAQRYCVNCGAHRRDVPDPAERYLSHAAAGSRIVFRNAAATGAQSRSTAHRDGTRRAGTRRGGARRRTVSLGTAVLIALVPLAGAAGLIVGQDQSPGVRSGQSIPRHTAPRTHPAAHKLATKTGSSYVNSQKSLGNGPVSVP